MNMCRITWNRHASSAGVCKEGGMHRGHDGSQGMESHPSCSVPSCTKRCQSARAAALSIMEGSQPSGRPK